MPPRRHPRSWLAGRLRSVAGAVQRLAGRVENAVAEPEPPTDVPRRLGEPPRHWVDLVAAHAPGLLRELDLDQGAAARDETPARRPDRSGGPVGPAARPFAGRTDRPTAAVQGRLGEPHPRVRPGSAGEHAHPDPGAGGPGHPDGGSDRRPPVIRQAIPDGAESSSGPARSHGSPSTSGRDSAAGGGRPFRAFGVADPAAAVSTATHLSPTPKPPVVEGLGPRSIADATGLGQGDARDGESSWPALPGEHPAERIARPHTGQHPARLPDQRTEQHRERVADHHPRGHLRQLPEHHAGRFRDQQQTVRYRGPEVAAPPPGQPAAPQHPRPERDQRADRPSVGVWHGQRGGELGQWDSSPGYGTGTDSAGRRPVSVPIPAAAVGPGLDPWPALPDDGPLWTVPGAALDAGHERRLDREQAGG
ncbi:hypothetical protein ACQPZK_16145 [Micromonospora sp. CA-249363]|uniref:hypothetical protein n=1 Tax=Micromonospora sp. CA-249363 TaxID=3239963 RepID=UPI003D8A88FF